MPPNNATQNFLAEAAGLAEDTVVRHLHVEVPFPPSFGAKEYTVEFELGSADRYILEKIEVLSWSNSCHAPVTIHLSGPIPEAGSLQAFEFENVLKDENGGQLVSRGSIPYHHYMPGVSGGYVHTCPPSQPEMLFDCTPILQQLFEEVDEKYLKLDLDEIDLLPTSTYDKVRYRLLVEDPAFKHFVDPIKQYIMDNAQQEIFKHCVRYSKDMVAFRDDKRTDLFGPMIEKIHSQLAFLPRNQSITFKCHGRSFGALPENFETMHSGAKAVYSIPQKLSINMRYYLIPVIKSKVILPSFHHVQQQQPQQAYTVPTGYTIPSILAQPPMMVDTRLPSGTTSYVSASPYVQASTSSRMSTSPYMTPTNMAPSIPSMMLPMQGSFPMSSQGTQQQQQQSVPHGMYSQQTPHSLSFPSIPSALPSAQSQQQPSQQLPGQRRSQKIPTLP